MICNNSIIYCMGLWYTLIYHSIRYGHINHMKNTLAEMITDLHIFLMFGSWETEI